MEEQRSTPSRRQYAEAMPERDHLIFVNYRGQDEIWATEFVYARMTEAFGEETVFKAGNALRPGDVYSPILMEKAEKCPVMLACVGPAWLTAPGFAGRGLESPDDWVRREIAVSLRAGNRVVPLLLGDRGAVATPDPTQLPADVRSLFGHQAWRLTPGSGLDLTVPRLIEDLVGVVPELEARRRAAPVAAAPTSTPPADDAASTGQVRNSISGGTQNGPVVMGRDFSGDITLGRPSVP